MKYTQFRYGKRVANPDVQWIVEGLKPNGTKDPIIDTVHHIIKEIGFKEKSYNKHYVGDVCLSLYFYMGSDEYIEFLLSKEDHKCVIKVEEFKSQNPRLTEFWEDQNYKSECHIGQDKQHRFIDLLIHNTRTLWGSK